MNDESRQDSVPSTSSAQQRSISPVSTVKSLNLNLPRPPLPFRRAPILSSGGAFTSYVRRRGEPDGGRTETESTAGPLNPMSASNNTDSNLVNTTDSELSDGYTSQTLNKFEPKPKMGYSSLRGPVKVGRPGGGGESDAAFTPSPPVAVDPSVSLALAHQTRIRNLYSANGGDGNPRDSQASNSRRPDSSSSASSTTDWESSGHATVLRRAHHSQVHPPLPPPRQTLPLVDSLRPLAPLAPVYNNLALGGKSIDANGIESTSSDSEFERGFDIPTVNLNCLKGRSKLKPLQQFLSKTISDQIDFIDKLSVRTELSANAAGPSTTHTANPRKPVNLPEDETSISYGVHNLYFSPNDSETMPPKKELALMKSTAKDHKMGAHSKNIQDSILRHMNREMTPTISDVYHERNLGLGLAPPLSKLLLSKNYEETDTRNASSSKDNNQCENASEEIHVANASILVNTTTETISNDRCSGCNGPSEILCNCKTGAAATMKKSTSKPWLSTVVPNMIKTSDLTTADILDRQTKSNVPESASGHGTTKRSNSPFSDLSRRDEGDGRSVADSQCSGSYKLDGNTIQKTIRSKFNL